MDVGRSGEIFCGVVEAEEHDVYAAFLSVEVDLYGGVGIERKTFEGVIIAITD